MRLVVLSLIALPLVLGCGAGAATSARPPAAGDPSAGVLEARGRLAASHGDSVRAEQYLALALERGAKRSRVLPLLLRACLSSSHLRAAINYAEPYLRDHPRDRALRYLVATMHVGLGQSDAARRHLELLLHDQPGDTDAHYLLGVLDSANDPDAARNQFRKYLDGAPTGRRAAEVRSRLAELDLDSGVPAPAEQLVGDAPTPVPSTPAENGDPRADGGIQP